MALMNAFEDPGRGRKSAAVLALVGFVNVPIIKFSVEWWNSLHQPSSVIRMDGPSIHPDMLWPLLLMGLGFSFYYATLLMIRVKAELIDARVRALDQVRLAVRRTKT
jgi:heme exporter protein C